MLPSPTENWALVTWFWGHCLQLWVQNPLMHLRAGPVKHFTANDLWPPWRQRTLKSGISVICHHLKQRIFPFPYFLFFRKVIFHHHSKHKPTAQPHHWKFSLIFVLNSRLPQKQWHKKEWETLIKQTELQDTLENPNTLNNRFSSSNKKLHSLFMPQFPVH